MRELNSSTFFTTFTIMRKLWKSYSNVSHIVTGLSSSPCIIFYSLSLNPEIIAHGVVAKDIKKKKKAPDSVLK